MDIEETHPAPPANDVTMPFRAFVESAIPASGFLSFVSGALAFMGDGESDEVDLYRRLLRELTLVRFADLYLGYVGDLLALVFRRNPDLLRSSETITFAQALEFPDRESLVEKLVSDRVAALLGRGIVRMGEELARTRGFALFSNVEEGRRVGAFLEARDRLARRRGGARDAPAAVGGTWGDALVPPTVKTLQNEIAALVRHATAMDRRAIVKWGLPVTEGPDQTGKFEDPLPDFP